MEICWGCLPPFFVLFCFFFFDVFLIAEMEHELLACGWMEVEETGNKEAH